MIGGTLLPHGERWAAIVDDLHTICVIKEGLEKALAEHNRIVGTIQDDEARSEYIATFADEVARCEAVINTCKERLK